MKDKLYFAYQRIKTINALLKGKSLFKFLYLNFLCSHVKRENGALIYPHRGTIIEFAKGSTLRIKGNLIIGHNALRGSKAETYIRLRKNATFTVEGQTNIYYCVSIDVFNNATLTIGGGEINCYATIMCNLNIKIGKDVLVARHVFIYDSDFHTTCSEFTGEDLPLSEPISIGDGVWLCIKCSILKGTTIEDYGIVPAHKKVQGSVVPSAPIRRR